MQIICSTHKWKLVETRNKLLVHNEELYVAEYLYECTVCGKKSRNNW